MKKTVTSLMLALRLLLGLAAPVAAPAITTTLITGAVTVAITSSAVEAVDLLTDPGPPPPAGSLQFLPWADKLVTPFEIECPLTTGDANTKTYYITQGSNTDSNPDIGPQGENPNTPRQCNTIADLFLFINDKIADWNGVGRLWIRPDQNGVWYLDPTTYADPILLNKSNITIGAYDSTAADKTGPATGQATLIAGNQLSTTGWATANSLSGTIPEMAGATNVYYLANSNYAEIKMIALRSDTIARASDSKKFTNTFNRYMTDTTPTGAEVAAIVQHMQATDENAFVVDKSDATPRLFIKLNTRCAAAHTINNFSWVFDYYLGSPSTTAYNPALSATANQSREMAIIVGNKDESSSTITGIRIDSIRFEGFGWDGRKIPSTIFTNTTTGIATYPFIDSSPQFWHLKITADGNSSVYVRNCSFYYGPHHLAGVLSQGSGGRYCFDECDFGFSSLDGTCHPDTSSGGVLGAGNPADPDFGVITTGYSNQIVIAVAGGGQQTVFRRVRSIGGTLNTRKTSGIGQDMSASSGGPEQFGAQDVLIAHTDGGVGQYAGLTAAIGCGIDADAPNPRTGSLYQLGPICRESNNTGVDADFTDTTKCRIFEVASNSYGTSVFWPESFMCRVNCLHFLTPRINTTQVVPITNTNAQTKLVHFNTLLSYNLLNSSSGGNGSVGMMKYAGGLTGIFHQVHSLVYMSGMVNSLAWNWDEGTGTLTKDAQTKSYWINSGFLNHSAGPSRGTSFINDNPCPTNSNRMIGLIVVGGPRDTRKTDRSGNIVGYSNAVSPIILPKQPTGLMGLIGVINMNDRAVSRSLYPANLWLDYDIFGRRRASVTDAGPVGGSGGVDGDMGAGGASPWLSPTRVP